MSGALGGAGAVLGPGGQLLTDFAPAHPTRVQRAQQIRLRCPYWLDDPVEVGAKVALLKLLAGPGDHPVDLSRTTPRSTLRRKDIYKTLHLVAVTGDARPRYGRADGDDGRA